MKTIYGMIAIRAAVQKRQKTAKVPDGFYVRLFESNDELLSLMKIYFRRGSRLEELGVVCAKMFPSKSRK